MRNQVVRALYALLKRRPGQTYMEYGLILVIVSIVAISTLTFIGDKAVALFSTVFPTL
jgi:Flp pilus assembly pilin Flp